ncbi:MAG TPA: hypothetical protein VMJ33_01110 [Gallionella sp.]|nr:hypothetical protein [Gallionella sp.]
MRVEQRPDTEEIDAIRQMVPVSDRVADPENILKKNIIDIVTKIIALPADVTNRNVRVMGLSLHGRNNTIDLLLQVYCGGSGNTLIKRSCLVPREQDDPVYSNCHAAKRSRTSRFRTN